ncbi:MAG: hypothetical protein CM15mV3_2380 [Caudoviricetes sp.]|nr:MAG: hypothetical protein CM15mV3_2380 [Caudoviricetes sp.]
MSNQWMLSSKYLNKQKLPQYNLGDTKFFQDQKGALKVDSQTRGDQILWRKEETDFFLDIKRCYHRCWCELIDGTYATFDRSSPWPQRSKLVLWKQNLYSPKTLAIEVLMFFFYYQTSRKTRNQSVILSLIRIL